MLSEKSFFKKIPAIITLEQRLIWEGAGWAIQMTFWSYEQMRSAAARIDSRSLEYPTLVAQEMFAHAWSIIDQTHMLRTILKRTSPREGGPTSTFIKKYEVVTLIRNSMDHLHNNIKNIAKNKSPRPPLFGALSFCIVRPEQIIVSENGDTNISGCRTVTITAGALTHPHHQFGFRSPMGRLIELPVGLFDFQAFEQKTSFSELIADLRTLVEHYDTVVKADQETQLRTFARENGLEEERVVNEHNAALVLAMDFSFNEMPSNDKSA